MATSGTASFNLDAVELIEEAYEIAGVESRSGYDMKTARRSLNLLLSEWANRGINFWSVASASVAVSAGSSSVALATDTVDILDALWRTGSSTTQLDRPLERLSVGQWSQIAYKNQSGEPSQYWLNRTTAPTVYLWPVPVEAGTLAYYRIRRLEDTGSYTNTMDVPHRLLPALANGLAYYLAMKKPELADRVPMLQAEYERQYKMAAEGDRERVSIFLRPKVK